jgi:hypothetical protein
MEHAPLEVYDLGDVHSGQPVPCGGASFAVGGGW